MARFFNCSPRRLVEGRADPLILAPDHVTGGMRVASALKKRLKRSGTSEGFVTSSAAPEMDMLLTRQLIVPPANSITPDMKMGFARVRASFYWRFDSSKSLKIAESKASKLVERCG